MCTRSKRKLGYSVPCRDLAGRRSSVVTRLAPPMAYHFIQLGSITASGFASSLAPMTVIPVLGDLRVAFPIALLVLPATRNATQKITTEATTEAYVARST